VTRLGDFSLIGRLFTFWKFPTQGAQILSHFFRR
jgi:hypothetical protein